VARDQGKTTRLQGELANRYSAQAQAPKKKKPQPGQGSLTEGLEEQVVEGEQEQEQEQDQEVEGPEILAQPKKSLFELPRKDPIRPSLLGGGVEVDPPPAATAAKPASPGKPPAPAPTTPGKGPTRRG